MFSENDNPSTDTETGRRMLAAEEIISTVRNAAVYTVRLAGLIGPGRHPGRFFAGRQEVPNGLAPVNLIHQADAVGLIRKLAAEDHAPGIFNGCAPDHPARQDFYVRAARVLGVQVPVFRPEMTSWKIVRGDKVRDELGYAFRYPDLMECLQAGVL